MSEDHFLVLVFMSYSFMPCGVHEELFLLLLLLLLFCDSVVSAFAIENNALKWIRIPINNRQNDNNESNLLDLFDHSLA